MIASVLAVFEGIFPWPGEKWSWKKESPKEVRKLEKKETDTWRPVSFEDIRAGDIFRVVGEPGYTYGASADAVSLPKDEDSYIMVGWISRA